MTENTSDLRTLWITALTRIEPTITRAHFVTWFQKTLATSVKVLGEERILVVGVPTIFAKDWISGKYAVKVLQAVQEIDPTLSNVEFEVVSRLADVQSSEGIDVSQITSRQEKKVRKVRNENEVDIGNGMKSKMLNYRYTLNNFIVGKDNRLPHAAATAVANMPGGIYNPLYIYGGVGLGKTHLLQAIGNEILKISPEKTVRYVTAEKFVNEVVIGITNRSMAKFKEQYRKGVDILLIDDVQFFGKKTSSQEEFFHTFNELYDANKQIVMTSDRPPSELGNLDDRLVSRFGMGMVTELSLPDFETKLAILQEKCMESGVIIDNEILEFVAGNVNTNIRELVGVLRQIIAESQLENRVPTIRTAAEVFKKLYKAQEIIGYEVERKKIEGRAVTPKDVVDIVASYYRVTSDDLVGEKRDREVMVPRQVCMYLIRHELNQSFERIGEDFGGRNHTTVMNACKKVVNKLKADSKLVKDINAIKKEIGL